MAVEVGRLIGGWIKSARENPPPAPKGKQVENTEEEEPLPGQINFEDAEFHCSECGVIIEKKIKEYSEAHFSAALCYKCQRKHKSEYH